MSKTRIDITSKKDGMYLVIGRNVTSDGLTCDLGTHFYAYSIDELKLKIANLKTEYNMSKLSYGRNQKNEAVIRLE